MKTKLLLSLFAFSGVAAVQADMVTLGPVQDTSIFGSATGNSDGGGAGLFAGTDGTGGVKRALLEFNFSSIPTGSIITGVQLKLTLGMAAGGSNTKTATIGLFDVLDSWGEGAVGNPSQPSSGIGGSGNGFPAATGDAAWTSRFFNESMPWTNAGGDFNSTASASLFLGNSMPNTGFTWSSTGMVADVQSWLDGTMANNGWELVNADESHNTTFFAFYSREWGGFSGGNAAQEPQLQVTYTAPAPEPASGTLAVIAGLTIVSLRPKRRRA